MTSELERLSAWLIDAGGHHDGVVIREAGGLRGVVATRPIAPGAELVRVPRDQVISVEAARARLAASGLAAGAAGLSSAFTTLATWLLVERRDPHARFRPYLDALPRSFAGFPLLAAPADVALLAGSLAGAMLDRQRADLVEDHAMLAVHPVFRTPALDPDELARAWLCAASRSFRVRIAGNDTTALVPFADMLNHGPGPGARWSFDDATRAFRLIAERAYAPGDEVRCDYGRKPNAYLLLRYGFCLDDNPADEAVLGADEQVRVRRDIDEPFARLMLSQLAGRHRDEAAARAALADAARAGLARFATTLAEDEALLAGAALSPDARNFIVTRAGEKRVIHVWLDLASHGPAELFRWP